MEPLAGIARFALLTGALALSECSLTVISGGTGNYSTAASSGGTTARATGSGSVAGGMATGGSTSNGSAATSGTATGAGSSSSGTTSASGTTTGSAFGACGVASNVSLYETHTSLSFFALASADMNGDGFLDLVAEPYVAPNAGENADLLTFFGQPDGGLSSPISSPWPANGQAVTVADVNGDGWPDVIESDGWGLFVLLNDGDGGLSLGGYFNPTYGFVTGLAVGDLNGDGRIDLAVAEGGSVRDEGVELLYGQDSGIFSGPAVLLPQLGGSPLGGIAIGDLNHDGLADLVTGTNDQSELAVLLNQGDGGFRTSLYPMQYVLEQLILVPNASGAPDIVLGTSLPTGQSAGVQVFKNAGDGTFSRQPVVPIPGGGFFLTIGDFNGDCIPDIAVSTFDGFSGLFEGWADCRTPPSAGWALTILYGDGDGGFGTPVNLDYPGMAPAGLAVLGPVGLPRALVVGDYCGGGFTVYGDASPH